MKNQIYFLYPLFSFVFSFGMAQAQTEGAKTLADFLNLIITQALEPMVGIMLVLGLVVFFWGVVKYIKVTGGEEKAEAKAIMFWGIIALFVMVSVWGLVQVLVNTFFGGSLPEVPSVSVPQL